MMKKAIYILSITGLFSLNSCSGQQADYPALSSFKLSDSDLAKYYTGAQLNDKHGVMNALGEWVIPADYERSPAMWVQDKFIVHQGYNRAGLINAKNEFLIPFGEYNIHYWQLFKPEDCMFQIDYYSTDNDLYVDMDMDTVTQPYYVDKVRASLWYNDEQLRKGQLLDSRVMNLKGDTLLRFNQEELLFWVGPFNDGMAPIFLTKAAYNEHKNDGPIFYGYINEKGKVVIPIQYKLLDGDASYSEIQDDYNQVKFENGLAVVYTREEKFVINKKGKRIKTLDPATKLVYPPTYKDYRMVDEKWVSPDFEVLFKEDGESWMYGIHDIGYNKFLDNGYCIQHNNKTKEFRIVNYKMEVTFKSTFRDDIYAYAIEHSDIDSLVWLKREYLDSLDGPLTRHDIMIKRTSGEKRLLSLSGNYYSDWVDGSFYYSLNLGKKYKWYEKNGVRSSELWDIDGNLLYNCNNCELNVTWLENGKKTGILKIEKDRVRGYKKTQLTLSGKEFPTEGTVSSYFERKNNIELRDPAYYQNPDFTLKFDEEEVKTWYETLIGSKQ